MQLVDYTANKPDFAVVICAFSEKRWESLVAAIDSVMRQTYSANELIVVIDHNPSLLERARRELSQVRIVENRIEPGAGSARNRGVSETHSRYIAFLDDDAIAEVDWLAILADGYASSDIMGVGGRLHPDWAGGRPLWFPSEFDWVVGCSYTGLPTSLAPVRNLIAANMSVRRDVFESIGGFRNGYGNVKVDGPKSANMARSVAGDEETEFCIRALQQRPESQWIYDPRALVIHSVPPTRKTWAYFMRRCYDEGLGKAAMSRLVGPAMGLRAELYHAIAVLPRGIWCGVCEAWRGDLFGLQRSAAIAVGLLSTFAGYVIGALLEPASGHVGPRESSHAVGPIIPRTGQE